MEINQKIPDSTMLKLVYKTIANQQPSKGFKVKVRNSEEKVTYAELAEFVKQLIHHSDNGEYRIIKRCNSCGNFSRTYNSKNGWCSNMGSSNRCRDEYCSQWVPMGEKQKYVKEKIDGIESLQTK